MFFNGLKTTKTLENAVFSRVFGMAEVKRFELLTVAVISIGLG